MDYTENKKFIADFSHWDKYVIISDDGDPIAVIEHNALEKDVDITKTLCEIIKNHESAQTVRLSDDVQSDNGPSFEVEITTKDYPDEPDVRIYAFHQLQAYRA